LKPVSPVIPGVELEETTYAKNQPEYNPLPCHRQPDGTILTRWHLTWKERFLALWRGDVYFWVSTFNKPLQPLLMQIEKPELNKNI